MKRIAWICVMAAGCSARQEVRSPASVEIRIPADGEFDATHRSALERISGEAPRTIGIMLRDAVREELTGRGVSVVERGGDGVLEITLGRWDLENVTASNSVTLEFSVKLRSVPAGDLLWSRDVDSRTVLLRPGERRDLGEFVRRLVMEEMRSYP